MAIFATDLGFPEGPVLLDDGCFLCVEMSPETGHVSHLSADGKVKRVLAKTGRPNGLALDKYGNIWVAETEQRALLKMALDGQYEVFADRWGEGRFMFPNDVAVGPDGAIYMTDSGILEEDLAPGGEVNPDWYTMPFDGKIFRIDPDTRDVTCLCQGIQFANGLAFSPAGKLYANETLSGEIFEITPGGERIFFGNVVEEVRAPDEMKGPDGMKFAADGSSYHCVFGQGDVTVLGPDGRVAARHPVKGAYPTNLVFGNSGEIYVTEMETGSIQCLEVGVEGLPLCGQN